jgi:hypothetical protein
MDVPKLLPATFLALVGFALSLWSIRYLSDKAPRPFTSDMFKVKNWVPVWRQRDWYRNSKGYWLNMVGVALICLAGVISVIIFGLPIDF